MNWGDASLCDCRNVEDVRMVVIGCESGSLYVQVEK